MDARRIATLRDSGASWAMVCQETALSKGTAQRAFSSLTTVVWTLASTCMFVESNRFPFSFPDQTLALTYDDGPGPRTLEIATFLHDQGIRATFFVVGKHVRERRDVVKDVAKLGHLIGNHTDTHPPFRELGHEPERVIREVIDADCKMRQFVGARGLFFRSPGGEWFPIFAGALNRQDRLQDYRGPVAWDIDCGDYEIGSPRNLRPGNLLYTLENCQQCYLDKIRQVRRGIVLLHDWSADPGDLGELLRARNRTLELTRSLIPQLKDFRFVTLDEIGSLS